MQKSCAKTGGGVGDSPLEVLNPEELTTEEAAKLMEGAGKQLIRPRQPAFNVTTAKKHRTVGSFPFYYVEILFLQIFNPRKRNIIIRWSPELHQTTWLLVMKNFCFSWMD